MDPETPNIPDARRLAKDSLQEHIKVVQETRAAAPPRRTSGKVVAGGAAVVAIVALWQLGPRLGWWQGGRGNSGTSSDTTSHVAIDNSAHVISNAQTPQPPTRPLRVTIQGNRYLIDGKETDLDAIARLAARVPEGPGPVVEIDRKESSRAKAEQELKDKLEKAHVTSTWMPPLE